jgi:Predicted nucleotide kinase
MGQLIGKIVLTGGPCAGKTTALTKIEEELTERGYRVIIVSESATELIKAGIRPFGEKAFDFLNFQRLILEYQLSKEEVYEKAIRMVDEEEKCVIVYDRGIMDNKAYVPKEFHSLVEEKGLHELDLLDNYDMVLHLVTAADGCPEFYTLENNQARSESIEEAIELDKKTQSAWLGHNRLVVIDNSTTFDEKLKRVMDNIYQLVHDPYSIRYQKKYLVDLNQSEFDLSSSIASIEIEQTYLEEDREDYERRLRKRTFGLEQTYYITVQKKAPDGLSKIVTDKKITEKEYLRLLEMSSTIDTVKKTRHTFIHNKQYMKLDVFEDEAFGILEVNPIDAEEKIVLPEYLRIEKEVTNDHDFDNIIIAKRKNKIKVKKD